MPGQRKATLVAMAVQASNRLCPDPDEAPQRENNLGSVHPDNQVPTITRLRVRRLGCRKTSPKGKSAVVGLVRQSRITNVGGDGLDHCHQQGRSPDVIRASLCAYSMGGVQPRLILFPHAESADDFGAAPSRGDHASPVAGQWERDADSLDCETNGRHHHAGAPTDSPRPGAA